jgi:hypothetical protein
MPCCKGRSLVQDYVLKALGHRGQALVGISSELRSKVDRECSRATHEGFGK